MTTIDFDSTTTRKLDEYIASHFPEATSNPQNRTGVALALWAERMTAIDLDAYAPQLSALAGECGITPGKDAVAKAMPRDGFRYYDVDAEHHRMIPNYAPFNGQLSMVRVRLPELKRESRDFDTGIGRVEIGDHFYRSVEEMRNTFTQEPFRSATRLDLVTPPRELGIRFGAISAYLGYNGGDTPSFYILEAGTATGEPKVAFECATIGGKIVEFANYRPTPFARKDNVYRGTLTLTGDSPDELNMTSESKKNEPYMRLSVKFRETTTPKRIWPGFLIVRAAIIVQLRKNNVVQT